MRRVHFVLLASTLTTAAASLVACGSNVDSDTAGSGGSGGASSSSTTTTSSTGIADAGSDVDNGHPSKMYPAPHAAPPVVINCGGPVLKAPKAIPIFFQNDDPTFITKLTDFTNTVGALDYWTQNTTEYGVGPLTAGAAVTIAADAPDTTSDDEIQTWLAAQLDAAVLPPPDPGVNASQIYTIYYPANTTIAMSSGGQSSESCHDFGGYHNNIEYNGFNVAYAVLPRCSDFDGLTGIDAVTSAGSHELIEAATDPYPNSQTPAYCQTDTDHLYWLFALGGGETADMCAQDLSSFTTFPPFPYTVQRSWSNRSAGQGHDPCVPIPAGSGPYFNAAPVLPDLITLFGQAQAHGIKIPVGESKTIEVDLFSDGDTGGPWSVQAFDYSRAIGGNHSLDFVWDRESGENGEKLHLTITVEQSSGAGVEIFGISSRQNGTEHLWFGLVGQ